MLEGKVLICTIAPTVSLELPLIIYVLHSVGDLGVKFILERLFFLQHFCSIFHTKGISTLQSKAEIPTLVSDSLAAVSQE